VGAGHKGGSGNEQADILAKRGASDRAEFTELSRHFIKGTSISWMRRQASEAKTRGTKEWLAPMLEKAKAYRPPKKTGFRSELRHVPKALASRYYQLMSGHALITPYLKDKIHKADSDECWWCATGQRQTREHVFKECSKWKAEITDLWRAVRNDAVGGRNPRWKSISELFQAEKATAAILGSEGYGGGKDAGGRETGRMGRRPG
jgi:hypothetical protein